jgi:hypothetical protein
MWLAHHWVPLLAVLIHKGCNWGFGCVLVDLHETLANTRDCNNHPRVLSISLRARVQAQKVAFFDISPLVK